MIGQSFVVSVNKSKGVEKMLYKRIMAVLLSGLIVGSTVSLPASALDEDNPYESIIIKAPKNYTLIDVNVQPPAQTRTHETETSQLIRQGTCDNVTWELYENGMLYFYGTGAITGNEFLMYEPVIGVVIEDGVTSIESNVFRFCSSLRDIDFGNTLECIDVEAFYGCTSLKNINIPASVHTIGDRAFGECRNIERIKMPYIFYSMYAFEHCTGLKNVVCYGAGNYYNSQDMYYIFETASSDNDIQFMFCKTHDTDDTLAAANGQCGDNVFWELHESGILYIYGYGEMTDFDSIDVNDAIADYDILINEIVVENGVTGINDHAFDYFDYHYLEIADTVTSIGMSGLGNVNENMYIFFGGTKEQFINLCMTDDYMRELIERSEMYPDDEYIKEQLEYYYSEIESQLEQLHIEFGNAPTAQTLINGGSMGNYVYWALYKGGAAYVYGSGEMQSFDTPEGSPFNNSQYFENIENYDEETLTNENYVENIIFEDGVSNIGAFAFARCVTACSVDISDTVMSVGEGAFSGCIRMSKITLSPNITSIGSYAFTACSALTNFTVPAAVTEIGEMAFDDCEALTNIDVESGSESFASVNGVLFSKDMTQLLTYPCNKADTSYSIPAGVTTICKGAFSSCNELTAVVVPASVKTIDNYAFEWCRSLSSVTLNDGLETIGIYAFYSSSLNEINIPSSVKRIENRAFYNCSKLVSAALPENLTYFGSRVFGSCGKLKSITIPSCVTTFTDDDIYGCSSLESINAASGNANFTSDDGVLFDKSKTTLIAYPPKKSGETYTIPSEVTTIGSSAFKKGSVVTTINIPASVTTFVNMPFAECSTLVCFNVDEGSDNFASVDGVLYSKDKMSLLRYPANKAGETYTIPADVTKIGREAFKYANNLTSVIIPANVASMGSSAFESCCNITAVEIQNGLTTLSDSAFCDCRSLNSIAIPKSVTKIDGFAFFIDSKLKNIYYTGTLDQWNKITIGSANSSLTSATLHPNSVINYSGISKNTVQLGNYVKLIGAAEGGTGEYTFSYYYKKSSANSWNTKLENTTETATWLKPGYAVPYDIKIVVTDQAGTTAEKIFTVNVDPAPLVNTSTADQKVTLGNAVTIKGAATGGTAPYKYSYYYKKASANNWNTKLTDTTSSTTSFKPGAAVPYEVKVVVKDANDNVTEKIFSVSVKKPLINNSTAAENVDYGSSVKIKGAATGGTAPYKYSYYYKKSSANNWNTKLVNTSSTSTSFKPGAAVPYYVKIVVTDSEGVTAEKIITCTINPAPLENTSTASEDIILGSSISIKGAAAGGAAPYKYSYYYKKSSANNWNTKLESTTSTSTSFKPGAAVPYDIKVVVTDSQGKTEEKIITCKVTKELVNKSAVSESYTFGSSIKIKGAATGGTAPYTYSYYYKKSSVNNWNTKLENTTSTSTSFKPGAAVPYDVKIVVTDAAGKTAEKVFTVQVDMP